MSDECGLFTVRLRFTRSLEPDRLVETIERARDANTAIAIAASREDGYWKDLKQATVTEHER